MRVAIHQPHYFPWLGYFDKISKSDVFVLLDEVQFEKGSYMNRNRVLDANGSIQYLTISSDMKGFLSKPYKEITTVNNDAWKSKQENALANYYRRSHKAEDAFALFREYLNHDYQTLNEWTCSSIMLMLKALNISTPVLFQSEIDYDREEKKSDLVLSICRALKADEYLAGLGGSVHYLKTESFSESGIRVAFQQFKHPVYHQCNSDAFVAGLSILDLLFNYGIAGTKQLLDETILQEKAEQ